MLQPLRFDSLEETFVVSDCHFRHDRDFIWGRRLNKEGKVYQSVAEHDRGIMDVWNERVDGSNTVVHLGDFIFGDPTGEHLINTLNQLNFGTLYLAFGNHWSGVKQLYQKSLIKQFGEEFASKHEVYPLQLIDYYRPVFFVPNYFEMKVGKTFFVASHYPIVSHNSQGRGAYHICGHSHGGCALTNKNTGKGRRLDVGIESFGGPVSLKFVTDYLKGRDFDSVDHH